MKYFVALMTGLIFGIAGLLLVVPAWFLTALVLVKTVEWHFVELGMPAITYVQGFALAVLFQYLTQQYKPSEQTESEPIKTIVSGVCFLYLRPLFVLAISYGLTLI